MGKKWTMVAGVVASGAIAVAGLGIAGAVTGGEQDSAAPESLPEPAGTGQSFADAMQEWASCVADAAAARPEAAAAFDPFGACGDLPSPTDSEADESDAEEATLPEPAVNGQAFAAAMQDWAGCVSDAAAARGESESEGRFDPFEACGEIPTPSDFGIGSKPDPLPGPPEGVGGGAPESTPTAGPPAGTPPAAGGGAAPTPWGTAGPPSSVPAGPPSGIGGRP